MGGLAPDASDQLHVAWRDRYPTGVHCSKLDVLHHLSAAAIQLQYKCGIHLKQCDSVYFCRFLQRSDRVALESEVRLHPTHTSVCRSSAAVCCRCRPCSPGPPLAPNGQTAPCESGAPSSFDTVCTQQIRQHEGARCIQTNNGIHLISLRAHVPGLHLCVFLTPPVAGALLCAGGGALLRAALAAETFFGACPPVDLLAVCLVLRPPASARCKTRALVAVGSPCHVWPLTTALPFYHRTAAA